MDNNNLLLLLVILFLMYKMCNTSNTKENFAQNNCDCQDSWSYWAPKSYDGTQDLGQTQELKFLGCDNRIKKAGDTEKKWCYTNGPCRQNIDPMSDSYQPFQSGGSGTVKVDGGKNDQSVTWRLCSQTKLQDEPQVKAAKVKAAQMKKMIDANFNVFSKKIGAQQCVGRKEGTCLNNFNTCVPKCFTKNTMQRGRLLKELEPKMKCAALITELYEKSNDNISTGDDLEAIGKKANLVCSARVLGIKKEGKEGKAEALKILNSEVIEIVKNKKYRDMKSPECIGGKATYVSKKNNSCCKKEDSCPVFLGKELGLIRRTQPVGKVDRSCIRPNGDYNKLPICTSTN